MKIPLLTCTEEAFEFGANLDKRYIPILKRKVIKIYAKIYQNESFDPELIFRGQLLREALIAAMGEFIVIEKDMQIRITPLTETHIRQISMFKN